MRVNLTKNELFILMSALYSDLDDLREAKHKIEYKAQTHSHPAHRKVAEKDLERYTVWCEEREDLYQKLVDVYEKEKSKI